ncbi:RNA polymerase sigma factor [Asticcacaulis sp. W401b]|uniref:RNA polymerase sigma factor n=1 Tax=Asticcacaulis sp. W401b TaxID=3388666 RepID=UPI003970D22E
MKHLREIDIWIGHYILPHEGTLLAIARKLLGTQDAARDVVQDVIAELLTGERWRAISNPRKYAMRMVYTRSLDILNRQKIVPFQPLPPFDTLYFADATPDAFRIVSDRQRMKLVMAAIDGLPPQRRKAFVLCRVQGYSPEEAGKVLGLTASGVRNHISRSLAQLTRDLGSLLSVDTDERDNEPRLAELD